MTRPLVLLALQVVALRLILLLPGRRRGIDSHRDLCRQLAAENFFALFFGLFFIAPQVYGLLNSFYILGLDHLSNGQRRSVFISTQTWCLVFVIAVLVGLASTQTVRTRALQSTRGVVLAGTDHWTGQARSIVALLYSLGTVATAYLGLKFQSGGGFRSQLVKSTSGQIATMLTFAAMMSAAALLFRGLGRRRTARAGLLVLPLVVAIFLTGSRGRILWPIALAVLLHAAARGSSRRRGFERRTVAVAALLIFALLVIDPLRNVVSGTGTLSDVTHLRVLDTLFTKRNFDGFANFAVILSGDQLHSNAFRIFTGARSAFMNAYFPAPFAAGVGFGATVPGWLYLSLGATGLAVASVIYGALLQAFNVWLITRKTIWGAFAYLFAIIWVAAVGGNFVESLDKMIAAAVPALLIVFAQRLLAVRGAPARPPAQRRPVS